MRNVTKMRGGNKLITIKAIIDNHQKSTIEFPTDE